MSTPQILLLLLLLPKALRDHPEWFTAEEREIAKRFLNELHGRTGSSPFVTRQPLPPDENSQPTLCDHRSSGDADH